MNQRPGSEWDRMAKPVLVEQVADVTGSGLGQEGRLHQVITYSDYRAVK